MQRVGNVFRSSANNISLQTFSNTPSLINWFNQSAILSSKSIQRPSISEGRRKSWAYWLHGNVQKQNKDHRVSIIYYLRVFEQYIQKLNILQRMEAYLEATRNEHFIFRVCNDWTIHLQLLILRKLERKLNCCLLWNLDQQHQADQER
jgi:hypothetical protein